MTKDTQGARQWYILQSDLHHEKSVFSNPSPVGTISAERIKEATLNVWNKQGRINPEAIHVIEMSAYEALSHKLERYKKALEYIRTSARGAIILSTQEGTKAEAFDFVVSAFEQKADEALKAGGGI